MRTCRWTLLAVAVAGLHAGEARALEAALTVENRSSSAFVFQEALHTYLHVGDVEAASVQGLEGTAYIDKADGMAQGGLAHHGGLESGAGCGAHDGGSRRGGVAVHAVRGDGERRGQRRAARARAAPRDERTPRGGEGEFPACGAVIRSRHTAFCIGPVLRESV